LIQVLYDEKDCFGGLANFGKNYENQASARLGSRTASTGMARMRNGGQQDKASQLKMISLIIPARDEAEVIGKLISRAKEILSGYLYEIIVVDDGSKDETKEIARHNGAISLSHQTNLGKGAAMKTGVENSRGEIIVFLDGDGAHDPQDIPGVIAPILEDKADLVIGSRAFPESRVTRSPLTRRLSNNFVSFIISAIISFLLPLVTLFKYPMKYIRISDCTSGFRAIKKEAWQKLDLISQGFQIETEMIYEAAKNNLTIAEVPISCNWNNRLSRLSIIKDGLRTSKLLTRKITGDIGGR
jgi:glycosyltransferase involved in cell wall biosynthesis